MLTITLTIFSLKEKIVFLRTQMIETEALTFGGWGHFFLIIKAIPQCLRIRIMLKKCWHRLTLEIRARHFFSILTLFFFPSSYLRDSWNGPVHGKRSQIPAADFSGRHHLLLCQRMRPCDIVSRWPHGSVSRRGHPTEEQNGTFWKGRIHGGGNAGNTEAVTHIDLFTKGHGNRIKFRVL